MLTAKLLIFMCRIGKNSFDKNILARRSRMNCILKNSVEFSRAMPGEPAIYRV